MKKVIGLLLFLAFFLNALEGKTQGKSLVDSVKFMLKSPPNDSVETRLLNALFGLYMTIDMDSALYLGERAKALAQKTGDSVLIASNTLNFGGYYWYLSDFSKAMECYVNAAAIFDKLGSETDVADAQLNISILHVILGQTKKAKALFKKTIRVYESHDYYMGISNAYNTLGVIYDEEANYDSAIYCFENCLKAAKKSKMKVHEAWGYSGLGEMYKKQGRYAKARENQMESLRLEEQIGNAVGVLQSYIQLGSLEKQLGNLKVAENYFKKAEAMPVLESDFLSQRNLYQEMVNLFEATGELDKEYGSYQKFVAAVDSIKNSEDLATINELNEKYQSEKKANEIITLQKDRELDQITLEKERTEKLYFILASIIFLLLSSFLVYGYLQLKKSKDQIDKRNEMITKINKALNKSQDDLIASNKTKDKFFALIAHDLRGPVTSMQGIGRMLAYYNKKGDENRIDQLIAQVDQSASSVNHLLDNLLKWALSQTDGLKYQPATVALGDLIEEIQIIFDEGLKAKEIDLQINHVDSFLVEADYNMISTVLRNLLSNAIKFSVPGGKITINSYQSNNHVTIEVADSGVGMSPETIKKILSDEPVSSTRGTLDEKGTGLGLILCRDFVKKHGGDLIISSSEKGTSISFMLGIIYQTENA